MPPHPSRRVLMPKERFDWVPAARRRVRILVVDDERDQAVVLGYILEKRGYVVRTARDGLQCLDATSLFQPYLIFLNVVMPRMDGYTACSELRRRPESTGVKVVLTSASPKGREMVREVGADAFLDLPFSKQDVFRLLDVLLHSIN